MTSALSNPDTFWACLEQRPTAAGMAWQFLVQDGNHKITMQASKANWRWIEDQAQKHHLPVQLPDGFLESLPEKMEVTFVSFT